MNTTNKNICPEVYLIEAFLTERLPSISDQNKISNHIKSCERCKALASELIQYFKIFEQEISKPVSSSIFGLINRIENGRVVIAGILLQPLPQQKEYQSIKYRSEIVLTTEKGESASIDDLDCIPVEDNEILIRAIQSSSTLETTLFLFAHNEKFYRNINLQIDSNEQKFISDGIGKIEMGRFDINELDNKIITITAEK
ncbi:MAG: hypothetical protein K8R68_04770 [Bacteroidales bacterium]|nr:hypothetical protein [Bacteroidales bacterium]